MSDSMCVRVSMRARAYIYMDHEVRSRVQKFPAWHTKAAPNGKCYEGIYSAIYGEVNVSVRNCVEIKGDYVEKYKSCFISVTLKSWSGRKLLDPTTYMIGHIFRPEWVIFSFQHV